MHVAIIADKADAASELVGQAREALRQAGIERVSPLETSMSNYRSLDKRLFFAYLIRPKSLAESGRLAELDNQIRQVLTDVPGANIGVVLEKADYQGQAVEIERRHKVSVISASDYQQLIKFFIEINRSVGEGDSGGLNRGVVAMLQFKGGVGATTLASSLGACWVEHGLSAVMIDLDDVTQALSSWAKIEGSHREASALALRRGTFPGSLMTEMIAPVDGYEGKLCCVGLPELYYEAFHIKSNAIEEAPPASVFLNSLINALKKEFDSIIIDLGRSWGVSTFAALQAADRIVLAVDDDGITIQNTFQALQRMLISCEGNDELQLEKWSIVLNAYTGMLETPNSLQEYVRRLDLLPLNLRFFTVPYSKRGRIWSGRRTLYDLAEKPVRDAIEELAYFGVPFIR